MATLNHVGHACSSCLITVSFIVLTRTFYKAKRKANVCLLTSGKPVCAFELELEDASVIVREEREGKKPNSRLPMQ